MKRDVKPGLVTVRMDAYQPFTYDGRAVVRVGRFFPPPLAGHLWRLAP